MRTFLLCALVLTALPVAASAASEAPRRKPGLWEIRTQLPAMGNAATVMQICIGADKDDFDAQGGASGRCSPPRIERGAGTVTVDTVCTEDGHTAKSHAVFSGDFENSYRGDITVRYEPPMEGLEESRIRLDGRRLGPCKPGQRPGEMSMPGMPALPSGAAMPEHLPKIPTLR